MHGQSPGKERTEALQNAMVSCTQCSQVSLLLMPNQTSGACMSGTQIFKCFTLGAALMRSHESTNPVSCMDTCPLQRIAISKNAVTGMPVIQCCPCACYQKGLLMCISRPPCVYLRPDPSRSNWTKWCKLWLCQSQPDRNHPIIHRASMQREHCC